MQQQLSCLWNEPQSARAYRSGVSLHSHTNLSHERLSFIFDFADKHPILKRAIATQDAVARKLSAVPLDRNRSYWTPPLPPVQAYRVERDQIEQGLGLASMVSITDHDRIEAPVMLQMIGEAQHVPISTEWSVPFFDSEFHIGLHNLPADSAESIMKQLADYTECPRERHLPDLFSMLHEMPEVLVVLNHPFWDLTYADKALHMHNLNEFVAKCGSFIHAFELNGKRTAEENHAVVNFAEGWNQLALGGGDRHGCEPNAIVNLTNAESFPEFVHEVRRGRRTHVLFMPQYADSTMLRVVLTLVDIIRTYPDFPAGSRRWDQRVFHPDRNGVIRPLSLLWDAPPIYISAFFACVRLLDFGPVQDLLRHTLAKPQPQFSLAIAGQPETVS